MTPATEALENFVLGQKEANRENYWKVMSIRTLASIVTCGMVVLIPELTNLLNITSGIALTWQSFVFAPIIYVKARSSKDYSSKVFVVVSSILHGLLGTAGIVIGSYAIYLSVRDLLVNNVDF